MEPSLDPEGSGDEQQPDYHEIYLSWNSALAKHFFNPELAGRRVVLNASDGVLEDVGRRAALDPATFVRAVKAGVPWGESQGLCYRALDAAADWRAKPLEYPPYLAALCLFVLAVGIELAGRASFAYYPRLRHLLGEDEDAGQPTGFTKMSDLWDDLEVWSNRDKQGELGSFEVLFGGNQPHVSIPKGQSLLTEPERASLAAIFDEEQLDPASNPPDEQLLRAVVRRGAGRVRPRTMEVARGEAGGELRDVLAQLVAEELSEWDGLPAPGDERSGGVTGGLRLQLDLDEIAGQARTGLRCVVARAATFPESGFLLEGEQFPVRLLAVEQAPSWSSLLVDPATGVPADASELNWCARAQLVVEGHGIFRMRGADLRVFVSGLHFGLPGLVEVSGVPDAGDCVLACVARAEDKLTKWLQGACEKWERIAISRGLPEGWRLWRVVGLRSGYSDAPFDELLQNRALRIGLEGGLRIGRGHEYFAFALPTILISDLPDLEVSCDGGELAPLGAGRYSLVPSRAGDCVVTITVLSGNSRRRVDIHVVESYAWAFGPSEQGLDRFGEEVNTRAAVTGVLVNSETAEPCDFQPRPESALGDLRKYRNLSFIGRRPNEFSHWPEQPIPDKWQPVWAVEVRRRGLLLYVGSEPENEEPVAAPVSTPATGTWREFLLRNRKKIEQPSNRRLARLWRSYLQAARK
jgi:hypothetical protein